MFDIVFRLAFCSKVNNSLFTMIANWIWIQKKNKKICTYRMRFSSEDAIDNGALCVRFRIDTRLSLGGDRLTDECVPFAVPFERSNLPFKITLLALVACCVCAMACFTWNPCGCRILENGRALNISMVFGFRGNSGGDDELSKLLVLMKGFRVDDDPAKLFRRFAVLNLLSVSERKPLPWTSTEFNRWKAFELETVFIGVWRKISGGGGGKGSFINDSSPLFDNGDGGGGKSGLGTRWSNGFLGGRSGIHSSSDIIGPITTGPTNLFE